MVAERLGFDCREATGYGGSRADAGEYLGRMGDGGVRRRKAAV
jgi:restriction endonuclease Mrr